MVLAVFCVFNQMVILTYSVLCVLVITSQQSPQHPYDQALNEVDEEEMQAVSPAY